MSASRIISTIILLFSLLQPGFSDDFFKKKDQIIEDSLFRLGIFYVTPRLSLESLGYTSNIYHYNEIEEPDWTADIGVDVQAATLLGKRFILVLNDHPYYSFYAKNKQDRAWNNEFSFSIYSYLGKINIQYQWSWNNVQQRPTSEFGKRIRYITYKNLLSLDWGNQDSFFITFFGEFSKLNYEDEPYLDDFDVQILLNREELNAGIRFNKIIFSRTRWFLNVVYFDYRFIESNERNGQGEQVSMGVAFPEVSRITGSFELGYKFYQPENPLYRNYSAPYGLGNITISLFRRVKVNIEYLLNNNFSFYQSDQYFQERSIRSEVGYYLNRNLKMGYKYQTGTLVYKNLEGSSIERQDRIQQSSLFFGIRLFKQMGIGLEYTIYKVESELLEWSRSYNFIGGYVTYDF